MSPLGADKTSSEGYQLCRDRASMGENVVEFEMRGKIADNRWS